MARGAAFPILLSLLVISVPAFGQDVLDLSSWDRLLKRFVHDGLVDYHSLSESRSELDQYFEEVSSVSEEVLARANREERLAFWLNLYNAAVIRTVLDQYPVERLDQIPAAFEIRTVRVVGEYFSLAELRDQVLRQGFKDERLICAIVSGRMDSPGLLAEAYRGQSLEAQLDGAAQQFAEDESRNRIDPKNKKILLSPLFRVFGPDFLLNFSSKSESSGFSQTESGVISFLLYHLRNPEKRLFLDSGRYRIHYLPEDPRLNDVRFKPVLKESSP